MADIYVRTDNIAEAIDYVTNSVEMTTDAVVDMQNKVIDQEIKSAKKVTRNLNVGFFNAIAGQIDQTRANREAESQALSMELLQQQKVLQNLKERMTKDYNRKLSRYSKLFVSLDQELRTRIMELDKPLMDFCLQNVRKLENRIYGMVSSVPVNQSESLSASQSIAAAHVKTNAQSLISSVAYYLINEKDQRDKSDDLQVDASQAEVYYIPVIVDEENTDTRTGVVQLKDNPTFRTEMSELAYRQLVQSVNSQLADLQWTDDAAKCQKVYDAFMAKLEESDLSKRVKDIMVAMFDKQFKTL